MKKAPFARVTEKFKDKAALVKAVKALATDELFAGRLNENKGFDRVSNAKLLRLHEVLTQVKDQLGSRKALIDAVAKLEKREKDDGYRTRLERFSTPRLWDAYQSAKKRVARA